MVEGLSVNFNWGQGSVPGAVATGSQRLQGFEIYRNCYPVATAPGTDLIRLESVQ